MKSILMIGMGKFGHHLCKNLCEMGNQVMIVDMDEKKLEDLLPIVTTDKIGDCTNVEVLKSLGVGNFDMCIVCIGTNFQSSLEITSLVKELGAAYVVSKANRDIHAKFLLRNGADEVIYPDRDIAESLAVSLSSSHVFDYIELTDEYSIYEISTAEIWVGKTIREVDFRAKYQISILATKVGEDMKLLPGPDYVFNREDHLMIVGERSYIKKLLKEINFNE